MFFASKYQSYLEKKWIKKNSEVDLPSQFPLHLRKFLPNVNFESSAIDGERPLRLVVLIAVRDIVEGEELLSSYFTILQ